MAEVEMTTLRKNPWIPAATTVASRVAKRINLGNVDVPDLISLVVMGYGFYCMISYAEDVVVKRFGRGSLPVHEG